MLGLAVLLLLAAISGTIVLHGTDTPGVVATLLLNAHSEDVPRTVTVGVNPFALVVAALPGRVFVLDGGDTIGGRAADGWAWLPSWLRQRVPFLPPPPGNTDRVVPPDVEVLDATR